MEQAESCLFLLPRTVVVWTKQVCSAQEKCCKGLSSHRQRLLSQPLSKQSCLSARSSCGLSCSEPSYLLPRGLSCKMLSSAINFYWLPQRDHSIPHVWALRYFKKRFLWRGTVIGVYKWLLIVWYWSPSTLYCSSFPVHQACPDFHWVEVVSGLPLPL